MNTTVCSSLEKQYALVLYADRFSSIQQNITTKIEAL